MSYSRVSDEIFIEEKDGKLGSTSICQILVGLQ